MNKPFFDENDIRIFFDSKQPEEIKSVKNQEITTKPEIKPQPYLPPTPPPGSLSRIQNSYIDQYDYSRPSIITTIAKFLGIFVLIFVVSFLLLNGSALLKKLNYYIATRVNHQSFTSTTPIPTPNIVESKLIIPQIKVNAPILWNIDENDITENLERGVVHYKGTALPGEVGNIFITGHSSYYPWSSSDYKDVFALLDKLKVGDKIYLQYQGTNFVFEVSGLEVVSPDNLTVLSSTPNRSLTLMTCTPVGTNFQRLIVTANQIL